MGTERTCSAIQGNIVANEGRVEEEKRKVIFIRFIEKGEDVRQSSILSSAKDWKISVDIGHTLQKPTPVAVT